MFRIRISYSVLCGDAKVRMQSKNVTRFLRVAGLNSQRRHSEMMYQTFKVCNKILMDELKLRYGNDWQLYRNDKQGLKSIRSAVKRMKKTTKLHNI
jgi:hypothetical protein